MISILNNQFSKWYIKGDSFYVVEEKGLFGKPTTHKYDVPEIVNVLNDINKNNELVASQVADIVLKEGIGKEKSNNNINVFIAGTDARVPHVQYAVYNITSPDGHKVFMKDVKFTEEQKKTILEKSGEKEINPSLEKIIDDAKTLSKEENERAFNEAAVKIMNDKFSAR